MKKACIYILFLLVLGGLMAFQPKPKPKPVKAPKVVLSDKSYDVRWDKTLHDFGTITEGGQYMTIFTLTNAGKDTVYIIGHETHGGCTVPSYSKEPLSPGGVREVRVDFNSSGKSGRFNKKVGMVMNGGKQVLEITGIIVPGIKQSKHVLDLETGKEHFSNSLTEIKWQDTLIDLGTIKEGQPVTGIFKFTNSGTEPIIISNVERWSSSVMAEYTRGPIPPGSSGEVAVELHSSGKSGPYIYVFGVYSNIGLHHLTIRYNVSSANDTLPAVEWDKLEYNFGKITAGEKVETVFRVTNNRKDTLEIENVAGSCGCLVPKWTKGRIMPGGTGEVTVRFNSEGKWGKQTRSAAVYTNRGLFTLYLYAIIDEN